MVVGTIHNGAMYLTPIEAVYQMRPSLQHLDAADSARQPHDAAREERELQEEEERMLLPLQVQVRRRETAKQTEMRVQSHAFLRQREHEEAWIPLQPSMPGDADTEFVKAYVTTTHGESCGQAVTAREYLDVMCPCERKQTRRSRGRKCQHFGRWNWVEQVSARVSAAR